MGFYCKFIKGYAIIAGPLTNLIKKDGFSWLMEAQTTFKQLKVAYGVRMGVVLMQQRHLVAFFSKKFYQRLQQASAYVRELHMITTAVKKWCHYLLGRHFEIFTDHKSIKEPMSQIVETPEQQFYLAKLIGYDFSIHFKLGNQNAVADALSKLSKVSNNHCLMLTMPHFDIL